jgi:hypothetical protein
MSYADPAVDSLAFQSYADASNAQYKTATTTGQQATTPNDPTSYSFSSTSKTAFQAALAYRFLTARLGSVQPAHLPPSHQIESSHRSSVSAPGASDGDFRGRRRYLSADGAGPGAGLPRPSHDPFDRPGLARFHRLR